MAAAAARRRVIGILSGLGVRQAGGAPGTFKHDVREELAPL